VTGHSPPALFTKLFHFAVLGVRHSSDAESTLAEAALCCVNELVVKNHVPTPAAEQFLLALFAHTFSLLKSLVQPTSDSGSQHVVQPRLDHRAQRLLSS